MTANVGDAGEYVSDYCSIWESLKKKKKRGSLGGAAVWRLPLAQGAILETRDRVPRRAPGAWSLLLPLPVSLPLSLSVCVTVINKIKLKLNLIN